MCIVNITTIKARWKTVAPRERPSGSGNTHNREASAFPDQARKAELDRLPTNSSRLSVIPR